ncbi:MAG: 45 kDa subunit of RNA polymerase II [Chaenotheca gracillima]|nr:MAG: 45 kDa subunit of RNA polymerase II [Chaenotheca gracillima]
MGVGAIAEPLIILLLLVGGTWINRQRGPTSRETIDTEPTPKCSSEVDCDGLLARSDAFQYAEEEERSDPYASSPSLLLHREPPWHTRQLYLAGLSKTVFSPNTAIFRGRALSRLLRKLPFLVECWYWALIYWTYQLGRAFTAVTLKQGTIHAARRHALEVLHLEQHLHIFWELDIQAFFLQFPTLMTWINRIYSFIHIPGAIVFLIGLYYYTITRDGVDEHKANKKIREKVNLPYLYEARRRTMAMCNLLAFVIFTIWPCMPPRLLSDSGAEGPDVQEAQRYGFIDTVHGDGGEGSVWTQNRFCNQYAAMPSLHFAYSLMIGLTIMTIPISSTATGKSISMARLLCILVGALYPLIILVAILATANHFLLDAVAGAVVCGLAWWGNGILLNLLPVEDWFLWCLRTHKPERQMIRTELVDGASEDDLFAGETFHWEMTS